MTDSSILVAFITLGSLVLFVTDKFRADMVAALVLLSLMIFDLVPQDEIFKGFSNSATITIAAMFVISAAMQRTGIVRWIANKLYILAGRGLIRINSMLMLTCGFFSSFTSNTATVAVLLPVSLRLAKERGISPSRLLIPLSFAAQFGGVCTLVGTTTNLLVSNVAAEKGFDSFGMFEFTKLGLICFVAGLFYMLFASRFLLKDKSGGEDVTVDYRLQDYVMEMRVLEGSPLIGQTGGENELTSMGNIRLLEIIREKNMIWAPQSTEIREGDILLIRGDVSRIMDAEGRLKLEDWAEGNLSEIHLQADDVTLIEVMIPNGSGIIGRSLTQLDFYWRYHAAVLGVRRHGEVIKDRIANISFQDGDTLLLQGHKKDLQHLADEKDFLLLKDLSPLKIKKRRALWAIAILGLFFSTVSFGIVDIAVGAWFCAIAMIFARCILPNEVYSSIDMKVIMLLACLIPLGSAMEYSGALDHVMTLFYGLVGDKGPWISLCLLYLITMVLTALMSNAATAVLLAPVALAMASGFDVDPKPFLMTVTFAASTCFSTPVGYQTNMMVYGPGGYRYADFLKVGLPLNLLFFAISVALIPVIWPF